jgi:hypothetical protein
MMSHNAIGYARLGWPVLPLVPNSKLPLTKNGFKDATTDETQINAWWTKTPDANIGICVGPTSNLFIIDVDNKGGKNGNGELAKLIEVNGPLPETYIVRTANNGFQHYFTFPKAAAFKTQLAEGVDLKFNGYVVAPPSVVNGRTYEPASSMMSHPAELSQNWVMQCAKPFREDLSTQEWDALKRRTSNGPSFCEKHAIGMVDVMPELRAARNTGNGVLLKHPVHGATGDGNLSVSVSKNLWHCFRCDSGGDPITWIAVREGFIDCADAGPLDKETFKRCKKVAVRDGLVRDDSDSSGLSVETRSSMLRNDDPEIISDVLNPHWKIGTTTAEYYLSGVKQTLKLPLIVPEVSTRCVETIDSLLGEITTWLYIEEAYNITAPICGFLCNFLDQEPDIFGLVMPSGTIKTEIIRMFGEHENQFCYPISKITDKTFISGLPKALDVIPQLRGRVVTIKDLTTILSQDEKLRSGIFGMFRDMTDGYYPGDFGTGVSKRYTLNSSILFGATRAIEDYYTMFATLGTRMVYFKPQNDPKKARKQSNKNRSRIREMRRELHDAMVAYLTFTINRMMNEPMPMITEEQEEQIGEYCDVLALMRAPVHHNMKTGDVDRVPDPEFPTRLTNTITRMAIMHAFAYKRPEVNQDDMNFALRIAADNIPSDRAAVIMHIPGDWESMKRLSVLTKLPVTSLTRRIDELIAVGICNKISPESDKEEYEYWSLPKNTNHFRIDQKWAATVEKYKDFIKIGGRVEEHEEETEPKSVPDGNEGNDEKSQWFT